MRLNLKIIGVVSILLICCIGIWRFSFANRLLLKPVGIDLPSDLAGLEQQSSRWDNYLKCGREILDRGRKERSAVTSPKVIDPPDDLSNSLLMNQIDGLQETLKAEARMRLAEIRNRLHDFQAKRRRQLEVDLKNKEVELETTYKKALAEKAKVNQEALRQYQQELGEKDKTTLANLRLQLAVLSLSHSDDTPEKKEEINAQIEEIQHQNDGLVKNRETELQTNYHHFQVAAEKKNTQEFTEFETAAKSQLGRDYQSLRQALLQEYELWYQKQHSQVIQAEEIRKNEGKY